MKHGVYVHWPVIAVALAVRSFHFTIAQLIEIPLDNHLGVRRNRNVIRNPPNDRQRFAPQCSHEADFVGRQSQRRGHIIDGVGTDHETDLEPLAALQTFQVDFLEV